jgi:hypothetical protein
MKAQQAEGWYLDPYQVHHDRWMSAGLPTKLVRDGKKESFDPPPDLPLPDVLVPAASAEPADASDVRRADEAEAGEQYDAYKAWCAAMGWFVGSSV